MEKSFVVNRKELLAITKKAFCFAQKQSKNRNAVLLNFAKIDIDVKEKILKISSTDNESAFVSRIKIDIENDLENFSFFISKNYNNFLKICKIEMIKIIKQDNVPIVMDIIGNVLFSDKKLEGWIIDDYPTFPEISEDTQLLKIENISQFEENWEKAIIHSLNDTIKPVYNSIRIFSENNKLKICATDSNRLYLAEIQNYDGQGIDILIPRSFAQKFSKNIGDTEIVISTDGKNIFITSNQDIYISRLIDGMFPDINVVIPNKNNMEYSIQFDRNSFFEVLEYFVKLSNLDDSDRYPRLIMEIKNNEILFENKEGISKRIGNVLMTEVIKPNFSKIAFSPVHMLDYVKNSIQDIIYLELYGQISPMVITDKTDFSLIMPIRIKA